MNWIWDERSWNGPASTLSQEQEANHTYITSSAQKPLNGIGSLPGYQVEAHTWWIAEWKMSWEHAQCVAAQPTDTCDGQTSYRKVWNGDGQAGTVDLRQPPINNSTFYAESTLVRVPDGRVMNVLPVPVIEVQGVIGK